MKNQTSMSVSRIASALPLAAALAALTGTVPAQAATPQPAAGITFATTIPTVNKPLPLFRLVRTAPPASFVKRVIGSARLMSMEGTRIVARDGHGVMNAYADARTGEAQIFPDFSTSGAPVRTAAIVHLAGAVFARGDIIPKDATQARLGDPTPILSASASRAADGSTISKSGPELLFTYVPAIRYAAGLQVFGDGSQATVGIGNDGSIRAFVRRWQAAVPAGSVAPAMSAAQVERAIAAQLLPLVAQYGSTTVDSVTPGYYDGDAKYLQPVYQFMATLGPRGSQQDHIRGYVPVGRLVEPLPAIGQHAGGALPSAPHPAGIGPDIKQITLGEYANRDGTMQDQANAYLSGFQSVSPWVYGPPINRTQWYWAHPYEVLSNANSYLNAVNVAYTMPHGNWWWNSTNGHNGDPWTVNQIGVGGNPGFGAASGGKLATWIIDSCEVIPSYYDLQYTSGNGNNAFNYWWPVFQGLHRALGFRTEMLLGFDTMNYNIAQSMAQGASADDAFFNGVAAVSFGTYYNGHLKLTVHWDRVSIMHDPRNYNESIYAIQGQTASGTLNNVWMGN